jgi:hypothetical protein
LIQETGCSSVLSSSYIETFSELNINNMYERPKLFGAAPTGILLPWRRAVGHG